MGDIYSFAKIFHFTAKLESIANEMLTPPIHIRLKPTNRCNHGCSYCCYRNPDLHLSELMRHDDHIPAGKMEEIISDIAGMGVRAVTFSGGGEPLIYPYFSDAAEGLMTRGVKVSVLTNGSLLNGDIAGLLGGGAAWVRVSMDGASPEDYSKARGVSVREFGKVCSNIGNFARIKRKECQLGVNFVVTRENHGGIFSFLRRMKELGVEHVKISEAVVSVRWEENREYHSPCLGTIKGQIAEAESMLTDGGFRVIDRIPDFSSGDSGNGYEKGYSTCPFIQCLTVIGADLNVYTCQDKAYTKSGLLGSIRDRSFREMWQAPETKKRLSELNPGAECVHHCAQHEKNLMLHEYLEADPGHLDFI